MSSGSLWWNLGTLKETKKIFMQERTDVVMFLSHAVPIDAR
jgi:hypothetical protein